jgi:hypothetical protein
LLLHDAQLDGKFDGQEMERVTVVGLWCGQPDPARRFFSVLRLLSPLMIILVLR